MVKKEEETMSRLAIFFGTGYEEIEALTVVDILRRAKEDIVMVSITGEREVTGSHGISVQMDQLLTEVNFEEIDGIVLPGGMPGTKNLEACGALMEQVDAFVKEGKLVAAICAAPSILGQLGLLKDKKATCYPGFEDALTGAKLTGAGVVTDGNITTARGLGYALDLGIELASLLVDRPVALQVKDSIQYDQV